MIGTMLMAAIVLAGGAAERLGGVNKVALVGPYGRTVLIDAIAACDHANPVVVVGPEPVVRIALTGNADVLTTCEHPAGSGPARSVAAGMDALRESGAAPDAVLVLAGDMPAAGPAVAALRDRLAQADAATDGAIAVVDGHRQWLLAVLRTHALARACAALPPWREGVRGESVRQLFACLNLVEVEVPRDAAADLDTWDDVARARYAEIGV